MEDLKGQMLAAFLAGRFAGKEVRFSVDNNEKERGIIETVSAVGTQRTVEFRIEGNTESRFEVLGVGRNCFFGIQKGFIPERVALVEVV